MYPQHQIISGRLVGVRTVLHPRTDEISPLQMRSRYSLVSVLNQAVCRDFIDAFAANNATRLCSTNSKWLALYTWRQGIMEDITAFGVYWSNGIQRLHPYLSFAVRGPSQSFREGDLESAALAMKSVDEDTIAKVDAREGFCDIDPSHEPTNFSDFASGMVVQDGVASTHRALNLLKGTIGLGWNGSPLKFSGVPCELTSASDPPWIGKSLRELSQAGGEICLLRMDASQLAASVQQSLRAGLPIYLKLTRQLEEFFNVTAHRVAGLFSGDLFILNSSVDDIVVVGSGAALQDYSADAARRFVRDFGLKLRSGIVHLTAGQTLPVLTRAVHSVLQLNR